MNPIRTARRAFSNAGPVNNYALRHQRYIGFVAFGVMLREIPIVWQRWLVLICYIVAIALCDLARYRRAWRLRHSYKVHMRRNPGYYFEEIE